MKPKIHLTACETKGSDESANWMMSTQLTVRQSEETKAAGNFLCGHECDLFLLLYMGLLSRVLGGRAGVRTGKTDAIVKRSCNTWDQNRSLKFT